jgi:hypothetical protein
MLNVYTVYERPDDYPRSFVVRRTVIAPGGVSVPDEVPLAIADTLREAREAIPQGCFRLDRDPLDAPAILEVWL